MVEYINVRPGRLRGGGLLLDSHELNDYSDYECELAVFNVVINEISTTVFRVGDGTYDGMSVIDAMQLISGYFVKNLVYANNQIRFDAIPSESILSMEDLNGAVIGLKFQNNTISFDTFQSSNSYLDDTDLEYLATAVTNLRYEGNTIKYDLVGDI